MRSSVISEFLINNTHRDLALMYNESMQCHVIVSSRGGTRNGMSWSDGIETWYPFIIQDELDLEKKLTYDFASHVEGIGLTGWDWREKVSQWVAFDFDSIINHKQGLTQLELDEIINNVSQVEWVNIRYSKSGRGLHLYVFLEPVIPTDSRVEHSAVARAILHRLSALTGYNFKDKVDICGGNMWVWHRSMATNGLDIIKEGISLDNVPNWKEHIDYITQKPKTRPFDCVAQARSHIALDTEHKRLINWLHDEHCVWWWDNDRHLLVAHTCDLKTAHGQLGLRGVFETDSSQSSPQNCFCFPIRNGGWVIRRFSRGVAEHILWDTDESGWTRCFYNIDLDLKTACRCYGGLEHPSGGFIFKSADMGVLAADVLGITIILPDRARLMKSRLKDHKDGRLIVEIEDKEHLLAGEMDGWIQEKTTWKRIFNKNRNIQVNEDLYKYDDQIRHLVDPNGSDNGWMIKVNERWHTESLTHVKLALESMGVSFAELKDILGSSILKCWNTVNIPFAPEYPGGRRWNKCSAQLRYTPTTYVPATLSEGCPTWYSILDHVGGCLDSVLPNNHWAKSHGILCGSDYLICWLASLFQEPTEPLPYLFLFGEQNTGKSILHEALSLLMTSGVARADNALINKSGFNGELASAVLCVIEEVNIAESNTAYNRIKDWVTSRELQIHMKGQTPYSIANVTHWIQTANDHTYCPIFPGDSRIVVLHVPALTNMIPKRRIIELLQDEAPKLMAYILSYQIPDSPDRLNVPPIDTMYKTTISETNKSPLQQFIDEKCYMVDGQFVTFNAFYNSFITWLGPTNETWTKKRVSKELPPTYMKGRYFRDNSVIIGNMSLHHDAVAGRKMQSDQGVITGE